MEVLKRLSHVPDFPNPPLEQKGLQMMREYVFCCVLRATRSFFASLSNNNVSKTAIKKPQKGQPTALLDFLRQSSVLMEERFIPNTDGDIKPIITCNKNTKIREAARVCVSINDCVAFPILWIVTGVCIQTT